MVVSTEYQLITLEDVDRAIRDWLDKTVDAHVKSPTGDRKKVSVIVASGERWALTDSRSKKGIRDDKGVLIFPLMSLKRIGVEPNPTMQALGIEQGSLQISKMVDPKSSQIRNLDKLKPPSQRKKNIPVYKVMTIPWPDRSIITYELTVQTQYIVQMNSIVEKLFHELDLQKSFVAPIENDNRHPSLGESLDDRKMMNSHYVVGFMDDNFGDNSNLEDFTDQERIVKWSTTIKVPATLQLDPEGEKPSIQVEYTVFDLKFGKEEVTFVDDPYDIELIFGDDFKPRE